MAFDLIGSHNLQYNHGFNNAQEMELCILNAEFNEQNTLISGVQMRRMEETQEYNSRLYNTVKYIRQNAEAYFRGTIPEMMASEHSYLGFIW